MSEPIHNHKPRTILQMLTSGDVIISYPGKYWAFAITNGSLPEEEFEVLMAYSIEHHPSQKKGHSETPSDPRRP